MWTCALWCAPAIRRQRIGRRGALVHHDAINHRVRGRRGARLVALTSGGAIPDNSDYRVVVEPSETFVGAVDEDFAVESVAGEIFQLGNASWRILRINSGTVRVADAQGQPPNIPFGREKLPAERTRFRGPFPISARSWRTRFTVQQARTRVNADLSRRRWLH